MNFILDQEEKVCQLKEYISVIGSDFMQLSLEVVKKLKEEIRSKENNSKRIQKITRYPVTEDLKPSNNHKFSESLTKITSFHAPDFILPKSLCVRHGKSTSGQSSSSQELTTEQRVREFGMFDNETQQLHFDSLSRHPIHSGSIIDWPFLSTHGLDRSFFDSINTNNFSGTHWSNLFQINELVYRQLIRKFFASIEFLSNVYRVYSKDKSREISTRSGLRRAVTVKVEHLLMEFWPTIMDGEFVIRGTSVKKVRDPRVKLAHRCIATTILVRRSPPKGSPR
ncbi:hypothetical protein Tco_0848547 [Tanacetum coccineum]